MSGTGDAERSFLRGALGRQRVLGTALLLWSVPSLLFFAATLAYGSNVEAAFRMMLAEGVAWYVWALATPAIFELVHRYPFDGRRGRTLAMHGAAAAVTGLVHGSVAMLLYSRFSPQPRETAGWFGIAIWMIFGLIFYAATASVALAIEYARRLRERDLHAARIETLLVESRLGALRVQLQPHFLFNALNTVAMLVRQGDQQTSVRVLARLSDLLRHVLDDERGSHVTLDEELETVSRYLEIEEIRFGDRLHIEIDVDVRAREARVPTLLLQPLVENAIRHGIARRAAASRVRVEARASDCTLHIAVSDDGPGFPEGFRLDQDAGIGLRNTAARLSWLYQDRATIETASLRGGGAVVRLAIPFDEPAGDEGQAAGVRPRELESGAGRSAPSSGVGVGPMGADAAGAS